MTTLPPFSLRRVALACLWAVPGLAIAWDLGALLQAPAVEAAATGPLADVSPLPAAPRLSPPTLESSAEMVARPLFRSSRRPPPPDAKPEVAIVLLPIRKGELVLLGVVLGPGGATAVIQEKNQPRNTHVIQGESVAGWEVDAIEADRLRLRQGGTMHEVLLREDLADRKANRR
ncbi:MAG TPA: hypothetical protein VEB64_09760 [Azospirillaceae bacterium]|nr:hypothetical protein [Azospirillaceae bacterium]